MTAPSKTKMGTAGAGAGRGTGEDAMAELADVIGEEAALKLARHLGGTTIYVPRSVGEHHPLRHVLGGEVANKLAAWFAGARLKIPKQLERRTRVCQLRKGRALTITRIALETGYSERHVYRILSESDDRQLDLFGE